MQSCCDRRSCMIGIIGGVTKPYHARVRSLLHITVMARKQLSLVSFLTTNVPEAEQTQAEDEGPSHIEAQSSEVGNSTESSCEADCCSVSRDKPNQPTSREVLAATKRMQGPQARYVQAGWFKQHTWMTLGTSRQKLYCFPCLTAVRRKLMVFSKNADPAFVTSGFCNWRKASERF